MDLTGKVVVVTGAAVRIGRAIALACAREGMRVCLHYGASREQAERVVEEIRASGTEAAAVSADLREPLKATKTIFEFVESMFGGADVLINNASLFNPQSAAETSEELWDEHLAVNLKAPFFLSQTLARQATGRSWGHIVNIVDWRATRPGAGSLAYTVSKGGLLTMTKSLAQEYAPHIRVNAIAPGAILPPPGEQDEYLDRVAQRNSLKRSGNVSEIAGAVKYLLHAEFVTGSVLHVSGGEEL